MNNLIAVFAQDLRTTGWTVRPRRTTQTTFGASVKSRTTTGSLISNHEDGIWYLEKGIRCNLYYSVIDTESVSDPRNCFKQCCGAALISAAPAPTLQKFYGSGSWLRLWVIFKSQLIKNSKSWFFLSKMKKKWMIVLRGQNKNLKETWIRYHILKNLLVMEVFLLDSYRSRSRSRKRIFSRLWLWLRLQQKNTAPGGSGSATLPAGILNNLLLLIFGMITMSIATCRYTQ